MHVKRLQPAPRVALDYAASRTNRGAVERMDRLDEKPPFGYIFVRAAKRFGRLRDASLGSGTWRRGPPRSHIVTETRG